MKVIVDDKIPYISPAIEAIADEVVYLPGAEFSPESIADADALIIRTRTKCDKHLLQGSNVKFIATATIGYDHIDTEYCRQAGIYWTNAKGCNSSSVAQYIESCLILLEKEQGISLSNATIGIVGVGNVGSKVKEIATNYGMKVLLNDPPRADIEGEEGFSGLEELMNECDIITFHVPLSKDEPYKTWHMADDAFFRSIGRKPVIINTSRGEVIRTEALLAALESGQISHAIIDVWENEPHIDLRLLQKALIATPHIAGYSADGKANATRMSLESLCAYFDVKGNFEIVPPPPPVVVLPPYTKEKLLEMYDPRMDSSKLKENPELFEWFRGNYPVRRERG
ncbi:4-phosphoerythronate dehydrogenase PdxB [Bacteroides sp. OttesenSCG-928-J23]|nr:4-phosphoerythronate dehydrogenase PdxB [Bacteroides sp. OttesenSCG-928-J23]MDL2304962.1 4-phosphoerythronate dehydrogenase PdxB [Bacteroides sp. OttesenSCG-928-D19]